MTDRKALIKPEKGETKEQFRERLKAALALGDTSAGGRADAQGEAPVPGGDF